MFLEQPIEPEPQQPSVSELACSSPVFSSCGSASYRAHCPAALPCSCPSCASADNPLVLSCSSSQSLLLCSCSCQIRWLHWLLCHLPSHWRGQVFIHSLSKSLHSVLLLGHPPEQLSQPDQPPVQPAALWPGILVALQSYSTLSIGLAPGHLPEVPISASVLSQDRLPGVYRCISAMIQCYPAECTA